MNIRPSLSTSEVIYNELNNSSNLYNTIFILGPPLTNLYIHLNQIQNNSITDFTNQLEDNWYALGFRASDFSSEIEAQCIYSEEREGVTPPPTLQVNYQTPYYQIQNLPDGLYALDQLSRNIEEGEENGLYGSNNVFLFNQNGQLIAEIENVSFVEADLDWSHLSAGTSGYKSFLDISSGLDGFNSNFNLFVPKHENSETVTICPHIISLNQIETECESGYSLAHNETRNGTTAQILSINDETLWKVSGLSGTGVISSPEYIQEITNLTLNLPDTGSNIITYILIGLILLSIPYTKPLQPQKGL